MTTTVGNLPVGTVSTDYWFDSSVANGSFPENRNYGQFSFGSKALEDCIGFQLLGGAVTCSYYVIDETNNQILFTITDSTTNIYITSVTPGTYDASSIVTQMNFDMLNNTTVVSGGGAIAAGDLVTVYKMAVLVDSTTSQMLFYQTVASATGKPFSISFPSSYTISGVHYNFYSVGEVLGFCGATTSSVFSSSAAITYDNSNTAVNAGSTTNRLYSPYLVQLSGPDYMTIHSDLSGKSDKAPLVYSNQNESNQLQNVIVNVNYQGTIAIPQDDKVCLVNSQTTLNNCYFYFTLGTRTRYTEYDISRNVTTQNYISFNGAPFSVGIRFFQGGRTANSIQSEIISGDKVSKAQPIMIGTGQKMYENQISKQNILQKKRRR